MLDYRYAYLFGDLLGLPIWLFFYLRYPYNRREMLAMSTVGGILSVATAPLLSDYWNPAYAFDLPRWPFGKTEDFLWGFLMFGIASVIYEELYGKRYTRRKDRRHHWQTLLLPLFLVALIAIAVLVSAGLNSIYALSLVFVGVTVFMLQLRPDLITDSLMSGMLFGGVVLLGWAVYLVFFPDLIHHYWHLSHLSGINLYGLPIEEYISVFTVGMVAGPIYEFFAGLRFQRARRFRPQRKKRASLLAHLAR